MAEEHSEKQGLEKFLLQNKKMVSIVGGAVIVVILGIVGYIYGYAKPKNEESKSQWWHAAVYLEKDSLDLAINGGPAFKGFQTVANNYSGTYGGNVANYGMGVSYLNKGQFDLAIKYLNECDFDDVMLQSISKGAMGDAYWELGQTGDAEKKYKEAIGAEPDQFTTPLYLMKLGLINELNGRPSEALKYYEDIKENWEGSTQHKEIEKYIARVENK